jgi:lysyl-tRNA synthetase class I
VDFFCLTALCATAVKQKNGGGIAAGRWHVGNLRIFIAADVLRRALVSEGLEARPGRT